MNSRVGTTDGTHTACPGVHGRDGGVYLTGHGPAPALAGEAVKQTTLIGHGQEDSEPGALLRSWLCHVLVTKLSGTWTRPDIGTAQ